VFVFFVQNLHAERPRPGKGWPGQIRYRRKIRNIAIQVLASLKKGGKKSHLCVSFISVALGEENVVSLLPPPRWIELTLKTSISQHLTLPNRKSFPFPLLLFFFLSGLAFLYLALSFSFRAFSRLGWGIFVGFCFSLGCAEAAGWGRV
jgi:hypothetical protein